MAGTYTYSDECVKCGGDAITHEEDGTQRIECQEPDCYHTEIA